MGPRTLNELADFALNGGYHFGDTGEDGNDLAGAEYAIFQAK